MEHVVSTTSKVQKALDTIGSTPGAILYRGKDRWRVLLPGKEGDILTLDDELMPYWAPPEEHK